MSDYETIQEYIGYASTGIITIFGVLGNLIILKIHYHKEFRHQSIYFYLSALAIANIIECVTAWYFLLPIAQYNISNTQFCKWLPFIAYSFYTDCSWILVCYSVDRMFASIYPTQFTFRNSLIFQITTTLIITLIVFGINLPYLIYFESINSTYCGYVDIYTGFWLDTSSTISSVILPFMIMLISTFIIIYKLVRMKSRLVSRRGLQREIQYAKILVGMDAIFFLCNLPLCVCTMIYDIALLNNHTNIETLNILLFYFNLLASIYNAFPVLIYLAFNKRFSKHFFRLFKCDFRK